MAQPFEQVYMTNSNGQGGQPPEPRPSPQSQHPFGQLIAPPQHIVPYDRPIFSYAQTLHPGPFVGPGDQVKKVRVTRAAQACIQCRSRKQKCDEARPCGFCQKNGFGSNCEYKDVPPPKQDLSMMKLQQSVNGVQQSVDIFQQSVDNFQQKFDMLQQRVDKIGEKMDQICEVLSTASVRSQIDQSGQFQHGLHRTKRQ